MLDCIDSHFFKMVQNIISSNPPRNEVVLDFAERHICYFRPCNDAFYMLLQKIGNLVREKGTVLFLIFAQSSAFLSA